MAESSSVAEARPLLARADPLVADDHLPDGDGATLIAGFLARPSTGAAAATSASAIPEELARATGAGALTVLDKPDPPAVLVGAVCRPAGPAGPPP